MADILRPLRFWEQVSPITEPPHLDRARAKIELVDGAISMRVFKPVQRNRAGVQVPVEKYRVNPRCHGVVSKSINLHAYV